MADDSPSGKTVAFRVVGCCVLALGLAACTFGGDSAEPDAGSDGSADGISDAGGGADPGPGDAGPDGADQMADIDWDALNGSVPDETLAAPEFAASNRDGSPRDRDDLIGQPTVLWFYPKAATSG